jgi:flavin-dependent dehydrogenase
MSDIHTTAPTAPPAQDVQHHDVLVLGGGLAGLTLALQLRQRCPDIRVQVLERRKHPVPHACHKVGESSVEIGAHYFENILGLKDHLQHAQLKKFGFRFFFSDGQHDLAQVTELGASHALPVPSWQIDRGIFENFLAEEAQRRGVEFVDGAMVRQVHLADGTLGTDATRSAAADAAGATLHQVEWQREGQPPRLSQARWLVDASGRAGLLKRKLGLARENAHAAHAVWFRVNHRIVVDEWSDDPAWRARCDRPQRWLSTNHLVGEGYWVWLIPLASGSHSVGIVADPAYHPLEQMNSFERAMDWLQQHQPRLHEELDGQRDKLQDFAFFRRFSYDCSQIFSGQRWALTGEAGRFLDPFYSPGSDFIAMGNTFIAELVARDRAGRPLAAHTQVYEQIFRSFYDSTLALYTNQYGLFADAEVMPVKVLWDYTYYWGVLAQLFMHERMHDLATLSHLRDELLHCQNLNVQVQQFLRAWGQVSPRRNPAVMLDQASAPWFVDLNRSLIQPVDDAGFRLRLRDTAQRMATLAQQIVDRALAEHQELPAEGLRAVIAAAGGTHARFEDMLFPRTPAAPTRPVAVAA